ncbi:MAG: hypothetical protein H0W03_08590 [Solirubrobacterales bacterium]|jgi:hypothetical protein|nr:hypothetical protein [Solirubrobacterales bacterium]
MRTILSILRHEVERRRRLDALSDLLDRLEEERGPVDQEQVEVFRRLLQ